MDKNWLIRTKSNHILGPVSKEKVQELYKNGSIKSDDEICSGNGYWFFLREEDIVAKHLLGDEPQGFNPVSEAKDVLTSTNKETSEAPAKDDITVVGGISLAMLNDHAASTVEIESPPELAEVAPDPIPEEHPEPKKKSKLETLAKQSVSRITKKKHSVTSSKLNGNSGKNGLIKWLGVAAFITLFCLIYFRKSIIQSLFQESASVSFSLINEAHAQEILPEKKNSLIVP
ncbi:MAG TPA: hypothetical protein VNJ08_15435 [Bacteriovoracaceae bacterium]|nr:hypothetical protein [Bacteriovoracaceae bacterium]